MRGIDSLVVCSAILAFAGLAPVAFADALTAGDASYALHAEGAGGSWISDQRAGDAAGTYAAALASDPENLAARWKLLRALRFEGKFATAERELKLRRFDRARALADEGISLLAQRVGGGRRLHELDPDALRVRLAAGPYPGHDVAAFYFWSALNWGSWGQVVGAARAVRRGVPNRIHEYALLVLALESGYADGGAHRLLAALHARVPRVPFLTGWADRDRALIHAENAVEIAPALSRNRLSLALTLLDLDSDRRAEALGLLEEIVELEPRPESLLEDLSVRRKAEERLERERGAGS